jgi:hypothetical protein
METVVRGSIVLSRDAISGQSIIFIHTEDQYGFKSNHINGSKILCLLLYVKQSKADYWLIHSMRAQSRSMSRAVSES